MIFFVVTTLWTYNEEVSKIIKEKMRNISNVYFNEISRCQIEWELQVKDIFFKSKYVEIFLFPYIPLWLSPTNGSCDIYSFCVWKWVPNYFV